MERSHGMAASPEDIALFTHIEQNLYTSVISDSLDDLGFRDQAMRENIRPVLPEARLAGWARTMACVDIFHVMENPYAMEIEAVDSMLAGEVAVVSTGESVRNGPWGELLSTASQARGARGAVVDGLIRDVRKIQEIGFPVFATGMKPVDSKGRGVMLDYNVPVMCGGILVHPGDLVVADFDGIVVVPRSAVPETIHLATDKASRESNTRRELMEGALLGEVFAKYGVL